MEGFVTVFDEQVDNALFWLSDHAAFVFDGARAVLEGLYDGVLWLLMLAPFWVVAALAGLIAWRVLGLGAGIASGLALAFCWAMGLWPETMQTLALVIAASVIALAISLPIGVMAGLMPRLDRALVPVLDLIQTLPPYIYLLPAIALMGYGPATALVATVIVAMPPAIRLTSLGIRQTPAEFVELGQALGTSRMQQFWKTACPSPCRRSWRAARARDADRCCRHRRRRLATQSWRDPHAGHRDLDQRLDRHRGADHGAGPRHPKPCEGEMTFNPGAFLAPLVDWLNANFHGLFALIARVIETVLGAIEAALLVVPAAGVIVLVAVLAWFAAGLRVAILSACCLGFCWLAGLWTASMQTIALVVVAVAIAVAIAFPLGIWAARRRGVETALRPVLDVMQTVPPWVYLIPAVMIFSLGRVPAIIATIVYGVPPMLRLTTLAFRGVPKDLKELGEAIGAKPSTILWKIELPAARPRCWSA
ncbi:ABC transporter permease [Paracoccus mutanolyticus]|uniref:ABC transporter permease n=1 Tax=Paracoccus mutanolyticus TaxID=1499308 RepID=UPI001CB8C4BF|nr:ABC transporter permease subunit [Paracoccus mutanolyticus]